MRVAAMGFVILVLVALTFMTLVKYWQLTSVVVDGDGIGVYFLGFDLLCSLRSRGAEEMAGLT